jgi:hypothetical protein
VSIDELKDLLAKSVAAYRERNPEKFSYGHIAIKSGNSKSFVERVAKNQIGDSLDPEKILNLAKVVCTQEEVSVFANFFAKNLINQASDIYKDALYANFVESNQRESPPKLEETLRDEEMGIAYPIIAILDGLPKEEIVRKLQDVFGGSTRRIIEELKALELVCENDEALTVVKSEYSTTFETLKKRLPHFMRLYKTSNVGKKRNFAFLMAKGTTPEGLIQCQDAYRKFREEIWEVLNKNPGHIPAFFIGLMDVFNHEIE